MALQPQWRRLSWNAHRADAHACGQAAVEVLITNAKLDKFKLRKKWAEWKDEGELLPAAFDHAPDEAEVRAALFATPPVEWNRLPHCNQLALKLAPPSLPLDEAHSHVDQLSSQSKT